MYICFDSPSNNKLVSSLYDQKLCTNPSFLKMENIVPFPAKVDTCPLPRIIRMRLFPQSATTMFCSRSSAMPLGALNRAAAQAPSAKPAVPGTPAIVRTTPSAPRLRMQCDPESQNTTAPSGRQTSPVGSLRRDFCNFPSTWPFCPEGPAALVATHVPFACRDSIRILLLN